MCLTDFEMENFRVYKVEGCINIEDEASEKVNFNLFLQLSYLLIFSHLESWQSLLLLYKWLQ